MTAEDVIELYNLFEENGIETWIDGGWGIDALIGHQTRDHNDLDIAIRHSKVGKLRELLEARGYKDVPRDDTRDCNFVMGDSEGREVDIHTSEFDENGKNIFGVAYPKESWTGTGTINGQTVKCIAPEWVIKFHEDYEPDADDLKDIKVLCEALGLKPPKSYIGKPGFETKAG